MNERTFLSAWDDTLEKTKKHWSQQNKIRTVITTIQQYWGDNVWERYLNNSRITYTKVDEIWKLTKECRDWGLASWLVLAVIHQCLEFRTQEQRKSAQVYTFDCIQATSEYHNFWNQNFQLVFDTDLYNHSNLNAVTQHLLPHTRSSSCSSFISQQCLEFSSSILQLIESLEFPSCLSTFITFIRIWCVMTSDNDDKEDDDNWSVQQ